MSVWFAAFLGLVQGVAEFLPISSSGHLSLFQNFFHMENVEESQMLFDVLLHLGTLVAVIVAYWSDVRDVVKELVKIVADLFRGRKADHSLDQPAVRRLILMVIVATLPLFLAVLFDDVVETLYASTLFVGIALACTGCILFISDKIITGRKNERSATMLDALLVGCMQAVAILPGISRSGSTITAGLLRGFDRKFAVRFSFLLSIPAVLGANLLQVADAVKAGFDTALLPAYLVGMVVAGVSGYFAIRLVRLLMDKGRFGRFAYYCWAVGAATIVASLIL